MVIYNASEPVTVASLGKVVREQFYNEGGKDVCKWCGSSYGGLGMHRMESHIIGRDGKKDANIALDWEKGSSDGEFSEEELPRGRQEGPEGNEEWDEEQEQQERWAEEGHHFHGRQQQHEQEEGAYGGQSPAEAPQIKGRGKRKLGAPATLC